MIINMKITRFISRQLLKIFSYLIFKKKINCYGLFKVLRPENVVIGNDCHINYDVFILGHSRVEIGNRVTLSARSMIIDAGLDTNTPVRTHINSHVIIEDGAWIGAGAIILPGVIIGEGSVVGAGSVVTRNVPPYCVAVGNPARVIKHLKRTDARGP